METDNDRKIEEILTKLELEMLYLNQHSIANHDYNIEFPIHRDINISKLVAKENKKGV